MSEQAFNDQRVDPPCDMFHDIGSAHSPRPRYDIIQSTGLGSESTYGYVLESYIDILGERPGARFGIYFGRVSHTPPTYII